MSKVARLEQTLRERIPDERFGPEFGSSYADVEDRGIIDRGQNRMIEASWALGSHDPTLKSEWVSYQTENASGGQRST